MFWEKIAEFLANFTSTLLKTNKIPENIYPEPPFELFLDMLPPGSIKIVWLGGAFYVSIIQLKIPIFFYF